MKWLVLIAVVLIVLWLLKPRRPREPSSARRRSTPPENMVRCEHCGVHLPAGDALPGRGGVFCGEAHRAAHEASKH